MSHSCDWEAHGRPFLLPSALKSVENKLSTSNIHSIYRDYCPFYDIIGRTYNGAGIHHNSIHILLCNHVKNKNFKLTLVNCYIVRSLGC